MSHHFLTGMCVELGDFQFLTSFPIKLSGLGWFGLHAKMTLMKEGVMTENPLLVEGIIKIGTCELEKHQIIQKRRKSLD